MYKVSIFDNFEDESTWIGVFSDPLLSIIWHSYNKGGTYKLCQIMLNNGSENTPIHVDLSSKLSKTRLYGRLRRPKLAPADETRSRGKVKEGFNNLKKSFCVIKRIKFIFFSYEIN